MQGAGSVGATLIDHLRQAGVEVMFNDIDESTVKHFRDEIGLQFIPNDAVYTTGCDIFAPCALGGILNPDTIPLLKCRAIVGGANNQLAGPGDAENLREREILYAPDYVVNVGGAMAGLGMEVQGWTRERAEQEIKETVRRALERIFKMAATENITTEDAACRIAEERLSAGR